MNTIVDYCLYLLNKDIEYALENNIPEEKTTCKFFMEFIERLSPSEKNLDN